MTETRDPARARVDYDIRSPFRSYFRVARAIVVEPEAFFRTTRGGGLWGPTQFVFVTYLLVSLLLAPLFLIVLIPMISRLANFDPSGADALSSSEIVMAITPLLLALILTPFGGVLGTFLGALLWHPFVAVSVGIARGGGFRETYRIGAYQSLPYVVGGLIPLIGPFLSVGGMAVEDVAWGTVVYRNAIKQGIGVKLNLWDVPALR